MTDTKPLDPHHARRWLILGVIALAQLMVVLDVTIVNIALPVGAGRPRLLRRLAAVGHHRLRARLRQPAPARRQAQRPDRPQVDLRRRPDRLRKRVRDRRRGAQLRGPGRRPRSAGRVRRAPRAGRALDRDHDLHRPGRAGQGLRRLRRDRRLAAPRSACCWAACLPSARLALDDVREPRLRDPGRDCRRSAARQHAARRAPAHRRARGTRRDRRPLLARLRLRERGDGRLGRAADDRDARLRRASPWPHSSRLQRRVAKSAAAAAGGRGPQPRRRVPRGRLRRDRDVRRPSCS